MIVGGLLGAWLTNAHRDAIRLGLQEAASRKHAGETV
jgi:hypothetical protein